MDTGKKKDLIVRKNDVASQSGIHSTVTKLCLENARLVCRAKM